MTKKLLKRFVGFCAIAVFLFVGGFAVYGSSDERDWDEFLSIVQSIIDRNTQELALANEGIDVRAYENLHLHTIHGVGSGSHIDRRDVLIRELSKAFVEALDIQRQSGAHVDSLAIITAWAVRSCCLDRRFAIGLHSEDYLDLLDFILDFTGIRLDEVDLDIMPLIKVWSAESVKNVTPSQYELEYRYLDPPRLTLAMGSQMTFRFGSLNLIRSLGHGSNVAGTLIGIGGGIVLTLASRYRNR